MACRKIVTLLEQLYQGQAWISRQEQPLNLGDSEPQPDVMVVPGKFEDYQDHPTTAWLIVEVADSSLAKDTTIKAQLYASAGIPEYWVVDLEHRQLWVFRVPKEGTPSEYEYASQTISNEQTSIQPWNCDISVTVDALLP